MFWKPKMMQPGLYRDWPMGSASIPSPGPQVEQDHPPPRPYAVISLCLPLTMLSEAELLEEVNLG